MKRILKWPKHFSNMAALTALEVPALKGLGKESRFSEADDWQRGSWSQCAS